MKFLLIGEPENRVRDQLLAAQHEVSTTPVGSSMTHCASALMQMGDPFAVQVVIWDDGVSSRGIAERIHTVSQYPILVCADPQSVPQDQMIGIPAPADTNTVLAFALSRGMPDTTAPLAPTAPQPVVEQPQAQSPASAVPQPVTSPSQTYSEPDVAPELMVGERLEMPPQTVTSQLAPDAVHEAPHQPQTMQQPGTVPPELLKPNASIQPPPMPSQNVPRDILTPTPDLTPNPVPNPVSKPIMDSAPDLAPAFDPLAVPEPMPAPPQPVQVQDFSTSTTPANPIVPSEPAPASVPPAPVQKLAPAPIIAPDPVTQHTPPVAPDPTPAPIVTPELQNPLPTQPPQTPAPAAEVPQHNPLAAPPPPPPVAVHPTPPQHVAPQPSESPIGVEPVLPPVAPAPLAPLTSEVSEPLVPPQPAPSPMPSQTDYTEPSFTPQATEADVFGFDNSPWSASAQSLNQKRGTVITIAAAKGGAGKSTLTLWAAQALKWAGKKVAVVDANLAQADLAKMVGVWRQGCGLQELLAIPDRARITDEELAAACVQVDELGTLLPGLIKPNLVSFDIALPTLRNAIMRLAERHDFVIVDSPVASMYENMFNSLLLTTDETNRPLSEIIVLVVNPHNTTAHDTGSWVRDITAPVIKGGKGYPSDQCIAVLNRADSNAGMDVPRLRDALRRLQLEIIAEIPKVDSVLPASNQGTWQCPPEAKASIREFVGKLCNVDLSPLDTTDPQKKRNKLSQWLRR